MRRFKLYFWNIEALKRQLASGQLPQADAVAYYLMQSLLLLLAMIILVFLPSDEWNEWDLIESVAELLILTAGVLLAFRRNGGANGRDILARLLSLGWVVGLRVFLPYLALQSAVYLLLAATGPPVPDSTTWLEALFGIGVSVLFYWRLVVHIDDLRQREAEPSSPQ